MRKRTRIVLLGLLGLMALVLCLRLFAVYLYWDEAPPKDADLRLPALSLPAEENAFTHFQRAMDALDLPGDEWNQIADFICDEVDDQGKPVPWDVAFAEDIVNRHEAAFAHLERGLACSRIEVPSPGVREADLPYLTNCKQLGRLILTKAFLLAKEGDVEQGLDEALKAVKLGHALQHGRGPILNYFVGYSVKALAYSCISRIVAESRLSDDTLKTCVEKLAPYADSSDAAAESLRGEYTVLARLVDEYVGGNPDAGRKLVKEFPSKPYFLVLRNGTKRLMAESFLNLIQCVGKRPGEYPNPELPPAVAAVRKNHLTSNVFGKAICGAMLPATFNVPMYAFEDKVRNEQCRLVIALKRYHTKTGALPPSLGSLVPEFIDKIPEDVDGKPIRYDPGKKTVYSIGTDLKDEGGDAKGDVVAKLQFNEKPARENPAKPLDVVEVTAEKTDVVADGKVVATVERGRWFGVLGRDGNKLQVQVCVGDELHLGWLIAGDAKFLKDDDIDLEARAFEIAKETNPGLDVAAYRKKLDELLGRIAAATASAKDAREKVRLIGQQLFEKEGFRFEESKHARSLDLILDDRKAVCQGLSILYVLVGRKLAMPLRMLDVPTHNLIEYAGDDDRFYIEVTQSGRIYPNRGYLWQHLGVSRNAGVKAISTQQQSPAGVVGHLVLISGALLQDRGNLAEACVKYARAAEISPIFAQAYLSWGSALHDLGKHVEAAAKYEKVIDLAPEFAAAHNDWGNSLLSMGKPVEAAAHYARAVKLRPSTAVAYANWALALHAMGKNEEAEPKAQEAIMLDPWLATGYVAWGMVLHAQGKEDQAQENFDKAIKLDPEQKPKIGDMLRKRDRNP